MRLSVIVLQSPPGSHQVLSDTFGGAMSGEASPTEGGCHGESGSSHRFRGPWSAVLAGGTSPDPEGRNGVRGISGSREAWLLEMDDLRLAGGGGAGGPAGGGGRGGGGGPRGAAG